jgi:RHS repeat-associated protein
MRINPRVIVCVIALLVFGDMVSAQVITPAFGSFAGGPDVINLGNLKIQMSIPIRHRAGRGIDFDYSLSYDSSVWQPVTVGSTKSWTPDSRWGWLGLVPAGQSYITYSVVYSQHTCYNGGPVPYQEWDYSNVQYYDQFGNTHYFGTGNLQYFQSPGGANCPPNGPQPPTTQPSYESTGGGLTIYVSPGAGTVSAYVVDKNGTTITPPVNPNPPTQGSVTAIDSNGNLNTSVNGAYTDTLNTQALSVTGTAPSNTILSYTAPSGTATYTVNYVGHIVRTNFGCSNIVEYNSGSTLIYLVDKVTLADTSYYQFQYEATPGFTGDVTGRVASIRLRTGDTITYQYSGGANGITCADGSAATLRRSTMDGAWTYAHSESGTTWTTNVTDPQNNVTALTFQNIFETLRQVYQGSAVPTNLLQTVTTCYNGTCPTTTPPGTVSQRNVTIQLGNGGVQCLHVYLYNSTYNLLTEQDDYDYATGTPTVILKKTLTSYAALGNGIVGRPSSVTVKDGSGNIVSTTSYNYDETTVVGNIGTTPQHVAVTGSRGNLTSIHYPVTPLTAHFTYYDTGTVKTSTDVNGAVTTYNFPDATSTCGNAFPTSIAEPLTLGRSMTWNCTGGVQLTAKDENNQTVTSTYNDPAFWRPNIVTDQLGNQTNIFYQPNASYCCPPAVLKILTFNNNSSVSSDIQYQDALGRTYADQHQQYPNSPNLDTVSYTFDSIGRTKTVSGPCSVGATGTCSAPSTTQTYDALNRPFVTTDGGNGTVTYSYTGNDVLVTIGPAPSGESTKRRQLEYDALGRVTSVCEITSAPGSGPCGQKNSQPTGFWTKYTYDALGDLRAVTQNAQAASGSQQTRSYVYDAMTRLTSETNPESGTVTYYYDVIPTGCYAAGTPSAGDLTSRLDAAGNRICNEYDARHRLWSVGASTGCRRYWYDSATVNGIVMANTAGRLAESSTDNCGAWPPVKIVDIGYSYTARGEISDVYQSSPHSGGFYHSNVLYWANAATKQLTGPGFPTITYGADGEGRINTVSASSGQNPVTATTYSPASLPTATTFGSSDSDSFTYDPNTNRTVQYKFTLNATSLTGALGWNANGTLQTQNITDGFNAADTQNCLYGYDDVTRLVSANCGSAAAQTFAYDPFGNMSKSGSPYSFLATYSSSSPTNRIATIGSFTPSYDSNGNVLNDGLHTYTWDAYQKPITIDGVTLTDDANGRTVEKNVSGTYTETFYGADGTKLALMNGQTLQKAFVPLPSGGLAVYNPSGLLYYGHPDHLGSIRLASTPSRTMYFDTAYAPFGETYASSGTTDPAFTSQRQDTVSNLYDFLNREYGIQGRWPSPDPAGLAAADPTNPQSWNRYTYVGNNPLSFIDRTGLVPCPPLASNACALQQYQPNLPNLWGVNSNWWSPFDLLQLAFTPTGQTPNPDCPNGDCAPQDRFIPVYGNLGLLNLPGNTGSGAPCYYVLANPCANNSGGPANSPQQPQQSRLNRASNAALHTFVFGQAIGTGVGCGVGVLVAAGLTAATDTYPLAPATLPEGCIGGGMIGFVEALPYSFLGAIGDFGWTYWKH